MYLLYLDDSGSVANANEDYIVLGGYIAPESSIYWINKHLDDLAKTIDTGAFKDIEFHASEIIGGRREPWNSIPQLERRELLKRVLNLICDQRNHIEVVACAVEKKFFPGRDPVEMAFEDLISRFQQYLHNKISPSRETGMIIFDKSAYETSLQRLAINFRSLGTKWGIQTNQIQEVPLFVDSRASRAIQLADHIAYAVFRRYQSADLNYFNVFQGCFYSTEERIHGLAHKTNSSICTCPACVQRKMLDKQT